MNKCTTISPKIPGEEKNELKKLNLNCTKIIEKAIARKVKKEEIISYTQYDIECDLLCSKLLTNVVY